MRLQTHVETAERVETRREPNAFPVAAMPRLLDRTAWRDAALFWLGQRVVLGALIFLGMRLIGRSEQEWGLAHILANWDGDIYRNIASGGYVELWQAAFFPLYPLLEHLLAFVMEGDTQLAGVIIANVACLGAFGLLRVLVERELGRAVARRTLLYIVIFPVSFFLLAAYAESLFLLLSVGALLAVRRGRWLVAGALIALATLTRPVGILLELALVAQYVSARREALLSAIGMVRVGDMWPRVIWRSRTTLWREGRELIVPALLPVAAFAGFCLYLYPRFHTLTAPSAAESAIWGRRLSWPWDGVAQAGGALLHDAFPFRLHAALDIGFTLLFLALTLATLRRLPLCYALPGVATVALALLTPMHKFDWAGLSSNVRFMLVVFPAFMLLAHWGEQRRGVHLLILGCSALLLVLLTFEFVGGAFVA